MPPWFASYLVEYRQDKAANESALRDLASRVSALEQEIRDVASEHITELQSLHVDLTSIVQQSTVQDSYEFTISGIPKAANLSSRDAARRVFSAIGLPDVLNFLLEIRDWLPNSS